MSEFTDVNTGDSSVAGAGSAPGAADIGGQTESIGADAGSLAGFSAGSSESGAPAAIENAGGLDAGAGDDGVDFTEEEIDAAPDVWRDKFRTLLNGHKSLRADHRALRQESERMGALFSDLNGFVRDEEGNLQLDPQSQLPIPSTSKFVERLYSDSPAVATQLFRDLWGAPRPDGKTNAQAIFEELGLDPARYEDYVEMTRNPRPAGRPGDSISPEELASIPDKYHDLYQQLSERERFRVQAMDDEQLDEFFGERKEILEARQFREEMRQREAQREEAEMKAFWAGVEQSHRDYAESLRSSGFEHIKKSLAGQVAFSADPSVQTAQVEMVMTLVSAMLEPSLRNPSLLQAMGLSFDPQFDATLQALDRHAYAVKRLEAIASNPRLAAERNDVALRASQAEVKRLYDQTIAKLNGVALKIAKAMTMSNQDMRDQRNGAYSTARPTIGSGAVPSNSSAANGAKPFTVEWLYNKQ